MTEDLAALLGAVLAVAEAVSANYAVQKLLYQIKDLIKGRYNIEARTKPSKQLNKQEQLREIERHLRSAGANSDPEFIALTKELVHELGTLPALRSAEYSRLVQAARDIRISGDMYVVAGQAGAVGPGARVVETREQFKRQTRSIDANLITERFEPGKMATLTITIRLPQSQTTGKWQSKAIIEPAAGPVEILLEVRGFTISSQPPGPLVISAEHDTAPAAFELRIEEESPRWLHILLIQEGQPVGELIINDFSPLGQGPTQAEVSSPFRRIAEADLVLLIRAGEGRIEACSPRDRARLDHVTMSGFEYPATPFRELLANRLRALYDSKSDPESTARELKLVGVELARHLPQDLITLLHRQDIRSVMLRHEDDFDFPLELVYLDNADGGFFVGDRIAICRWYLGVKNLPDFVTKKIGKVAFLKGIDKAYQADEVLLNERFKGRTETFETKNAVINKVFKTSDFDLIHFTGHCRKRDDAMGGWNWRMASFYA
jgi:hypothetical protein